MSNEDIALRFWNLPQKGAEEARRESLFIDDIIQKAHIDRELRLNISGVRTVFDGGAGSGRFSVPLAKSGIRVTHFDCSESMMAAAKEYADREGVSDRIDFVLGRLGDLSQFADNEFDLVMSIDAPVSYTFPDHETVIGNLVRIARSKVILGVSSRLGSLAYLLNPMQKVQYLLNPNHDDYLVKAHSTVDKSILARFKIDMEALSRVYNIGLFSEGLEEADAYKRGDAPWPATYLFLPDELEQILRRCGLSQIKLAGPGAFSRSIPNEILVRIMDDNKTKEAFLDFCFQFDSQQSVAGLGKDNLVATGTKVQ